jgi:putative PIN family toxin of toxin-antitoxin system
MAVRKRRIAVVLDTNVLVRNFKARSPSSANSRIFRLWLLERRLQLVVSPELVEEYLEIFASILGLDEEKVAQWQERFEQDGRCDKVSLGRRYTESRDPDDNIVLATATAGRANYLITNDLDLLELPKDFQRQLPFRILRPAGFLHAIEETEP